MKYENIVSAKFISRPNRFIAMVELIESGVETEPIAVQTILARVFLFLLYDIIIVSVF